VAFTDEPPALIRERTVEPSDSDTHTEPLRPAHSASCLEVYDAPAAEFRLYHLELRGEECEVLSAGLPLIAVCISGDVTIDEVYTPPATGSRSLARGASALITSDVRSFRVRGRGRLFVAAPGRVSP